jgi:hypothetical protein
MPLNKAVFYWHHRTNEPWKPEIHQGKVFGTLPVFAQIKDYFNRSIKCYNHDISFWNLCSLPCYCMTKHRHDKIPWSRIILIFLKFLSISPHKKIKSNQDNIWMYDKFSESHVIINKSALTAGPCMIPSNVLYLKSRILSSSQHKDIPAILIFLKSLNLISPQNN